MTDDNDAATTSFLDIITCGLGSVLLLFFLMVVIKGEMQFDSSSSDETTQSVGSSQKAGTAPLVVLVTAADGKRLWAAEGAEPWQLPDAPFDHEKQSGPNYAVLYARQTPPPGWTLSVGPFAPDARVNVQVIANGKRVYHINNADVKSLNWRRGDFLPVWPVPEGVAR